jgi:hypothetical protein
MKAIIRNERGVALILALLITLAVAAMAMGGVMIASSGTLTARFTAEPEWCWAESTGKRGT